MRRRVRPSGLLLLAGWVLLAGCGAEPPIAGPGIELSLRVTAGARSVAIGEPFPLTVVRVWRKGLVPSEWSDAALAPLAVRLDGTARREDRDHVEETRRYRGYAFSLGDVSVPAPTMRAAPRGGGAERVASGNLLALEVRRALDPAGPGPAEPPEPLDAPFRWLPWAAAATALVTALAVGVARRRRRPAPAPPPAPSAAPAPGPHVAALERLALLRAASPDDLAALHVAAAAILRDYAAARFGVRAAEMTTEELLGTVPGPALARALRQCDLVKFARYAPGPGERARVLDDAEAFVRESAA